MTKLRRAVFIGTFCAVFAAAGLFAADASSTNQTVTSTPVYVPDTSHANEPLPDGVLAWSSLLQATNAAADQEQAHFAFSFTNVSSGNVAVLSAHASCGCTQPELPPLPWIIPPGGKGEFSATVSIEGKQGTLFKSVTISTDKGSKDLYLRITMLPPVVPTLTDADRARGVEMARADRQAVFKDDCATCHAKPATGKYGKALYDSACAICHEAQNRATMVPDLRNLKTPTNDEFWRTWIAHGKAGTLMPAFSTAEGGPLNDMQIATVAAYLNLVIPSQPAPAVTNAPAAN
jgi:mono/diheme cytochrome c family protein